MNTDIQLLDRGLDDVRDLIKNTWVPNASDGQAAVFWETCKSLGLNPAAKQICGQVRNERIRDRDGRDQWVPRLLIIVQVAGLRSVAERSGQYGGQLGPEFTADGETWSPVWQPTPDQPHPIAARVGIIRKDWAEPLWQHVTWDEFCVTDRKGDLAHQYRSMPSHMLGLRAEGLGLRRAFPQLSAVVTPEEADAIEVAQVKATSSRESFDPGRMNVASRDLPAPCETIESTGRLNEVTTSMSDHAIDTDEIRELMVERNWSRADVEGPIGAWPAISIASIGQCMRQLLERRKTSASPVGEVEQQPGQLVDTQA